MRQLWLGRRLSIAQRSWSESGGPDLVATLQNCCRELRIRRRVSLRIASDNIGPATWGVMHPLVVIPASLLGSLSAAERRLVFLHELMHIRRLDVLTNRLGSLIVAIHWFNPVAWLALFALRREREMACDAAVLDRLDAQESGDYGG